MTVKDSDGTTRRIESACKVWSAGVFGEPAGRTGRRASGCRGRPRRPHQVSPDLTVPGYPNVFVIGDMASVPGVPGMAQGAIQGAKHAAGAISAELKGATPAVREPFHYFGKGSMATVSRHSAVAKVGPLELSGYVAWVAWFGTAPGLSRRVQKQDHHVDFVDNDLPDDESGPTQHHRAASPRPVARPTTSDSAVNAA